MLIELHSKESSEITGLGVAPVAPVAEAAQVESAQAAQAAQASQLAEVEAEAEVEQQICLQMLKGVIYSNILMIFWL